MYRHEVNCEAGPRYLQDYQPKVVVGGVGAVSVNERGMHR